MEHTQVSDSSTLFDSLRSSPFLRSREYSFKHNMVALSDQADIFEKCLHPLEYSIWRTTHLILKEFYWDILHASF